MDKIRAYDDQKLRRAHRMHVAVAVVFAIPLAYSIASMGWSARVPVDALLWLLIVVGHGRLASRCRAEKARRGAVPNPEIGDRGPTTRTG